MIKANHNGAYEYLWFEHKYSILAVGRKAYQNTGSKLGRFPQTMSFLKSIAFYYKEKPTESYAAILSAYNHIKPFLNRKEKFQIISSFLDDSNIAKELIYSKAVEYNEKSLPGCRIFFDNNFALYKFWDKDDLPGLWLCFGPFQIHLSPDFVLLRASFYTGIELPELIKYMNLLKNVVDIKTFESWPKSLKLYFKMNNMIALPGNTARLHPRIYLNFDSLEKCDDLIVSNHKIAALIQEKIWDFTSDEDLEFPNMVDYDTFCSEFNENNFAYLKWPDNSDVEESYNFLKESFDNQKVIDQHKK